MTKQQKIACEHIKQAKAAIAAQMKLAFTNGTVDNVDGFGKASEIESIETVEDSTFVINMEIDGQPVRMLVGVNKIAPI